MNLKTSSFRCNLNNEAFLENASKTTTKSSVINAALQIAQDLTKKSKSISSDLIKVIESFSELRNVKIISPLSFRQHILVAAANRSDKDLIDAINEFDDQTIWSLYFYFLIH